MNNPNPAGLPDALLASLARYLDEEDGPAALQDACAQVDAAPLDITALLDWLQRYRCEPLRKTLATRAMRAALRLPAIPGPVCRADPSN